MRNVSKLQYEPITDSQRRALIRYYSAYTQVFGEFLPLLVNSGALSPAFTAKDVSNALNNLGIKHSMSSLYANLHDLYNPIVNNVQNSDFFAKSTVFGEKIIKSAENSEDNVELWYIRPRYETIDMIEHTAWYREYEMGHNKLIPPIDVYEEALSPDELQIIDHLYEKSGWRPSHSTRWMSNYRHFTDFSIKSRTTIDNTVITKPARFKIAFLEAVIIGGVWSGFDIMRETGIHVDNVRYILKNSNLHREVRREIVEAKSISEALERAKEPGHAVKLSNDTYMIQLKSLIRPKTSEELAAIRNYVRGETPENGKSPRTNMQRIKWALSLPTFQPKFLSRSLRKISEKALGKKLPAHLISVPAILDYVSKETEP